MRYPEFHYRWEYELETSPEQLWPLVSDTNRFNYDTHLPGVERLVPNEGEERTDGRRLRFSILGVEVEWEEEPFEWVRPYRFGVVRRYLKGSLEKMSVLADLTPLDGGGTFLVYQVWARPRTPIGLIATPLWIGWLSAHRFSAAFRQYDQIAAKGISSLVQPAQVSFATGGRERLASLSEALAAQGASPELVERLVEIIEQADELTLARLRPYALADYWGVGRRTVLELCLMATRTGLLDFRWELLCPLCRGAKQSGATLGDIQSQVHCDSCNIDFKVNFDRLVELTFRPNPAVRQVDNREFCIGGPQVTPHIVVQQLLQPDEERTLKMGVPLEEGRYRLRTLGLPGGQMLYAEAEGVTDVQLIASTQPWPHEEVNISTTSSLRLKNGTEYPQLFILERMAWSDLAATAAEVIALQRFRDLFAHEALRPGEQISVGSMTILFTDLRSSTGLYSEIGDASAFGLVMAHFDVLKEAISFEDGTLVKTIGDAVMAAFRRPAGAVRAVLNAQRDLRSPPSGARPLLLKAGIHYGHCIAVTLNERLDYFGATVNIAARLESLSSGGDVIVSDAVLADPEVSELLDELSDRVRVETFEAKLRGLEEKDFRLCRLVHTWAG